MEGQLWCSSISVAAIELQFLLGVVLCSNLCEVPEHTPSRMGQNGLLWMNICSVFIVNCQTWHTETSPEQSLHNGNGIAGKGALCSLVQRSVGLS
jgi:hypothetical protein